MNEQEILRRFSELGVMVTGSHVVLMSGKHGSAYVNKDALYPHTSDTSDLCRVMARQFMDRGIEVVAGPEKGGIILSQWTAYHLQRLSATRDAREVLAVYAERNGRDFVFRRGYDKLVAGRRVLVVEDVLTTGGSAKKVVEAVRGLGGEVVALTVLCNRGGVKSQDVGDVPELFALVNITTMNTWVPAECPYCAKSIPINTDIGKGKEFLASKNR